MIETGYPPERMPTPHVVNMAENKKELDITQDELQRITEAFKKEEFRKLFREYAEEIADPENKKRYEEEIKIMESERGINAKFINPDPGYVVKTLVDGETKAFINICKNDVIDKPSASKGVGENGRSGLQWSIPHSFAPPKDDIDKKGDKCKVFDVVFHPDTYRMAETNARFKQMLHDTAMEGIERQFGVELDRNNLTFPKMKYKGVVTATVIREKADTPAEPRDPNDPIANFPYPYDDTATAENRKRNEDIETRENKQDDDKKSSKQQEKDGHTTPKYTITHRSDVDFQHFVDSPHLTKDSTLKELVVAIDLPLIKSAKSVDLEFFERKMVLKTEKPVKYHLDLVLPYLVDDENGSAKFDKTKRKLTVTLPVVQSNRSVTTNFVGKFEAEHIGEDKKPDSWTGQNSSEVSEEAFLSEESSALIEVISSHETEGDENDIEQSCNGKTENKAIWLDSEIDCKKIPLPQISYVLPEYEFFQDNKVVTFIFHVKKVKADTVIKKFPSNKENSCHLKFASVGAGGFPMHYSFFVRFPSPYVIEVEKCEVDIAKQNVVLLMYKHKETRGNWENFFAGRNETSLQERFFVTDESVCLELKELEQGTMPSLQASSSPVLTVTDMNDNHTKIHVKGGNGAEHGDAEVTPRLNRPVSESSDDIQVVYDSESPQLHSILKQRTISESSDISEPCGVSFSRENSLSYESPISESDEGGERKKSVSFSEYVDSTMFKCNQSVSSLKASLKSKKKRQKQREARFQAKCEQRRRRRSSGSEHSSDCEESSSQTSESDVTSAVAVSSDVSVESAEAPNEVFEKSSVSESSMLTTNKPHVTQPAQQTKNNKGKKNRSKRNKKNKNGKRNGSASDGHEPLETSEEGDHSESKTCDSTDGQTDESEGDPVHLPAHIDTDAPCSSLNVLQTENPAKDCNTKQEGENAPCKPKVKLISGQEDDSDDGDDAGVERTNDAAGAGDGKKSSMLSWQEGEATDPAHKTQCAFEFTNSVMYDLDEE